MELKDTISLMLSDKFEDRFKAEYWQTKIRYNKLHKWLVDCDAGNKPEPAYYDSEYVAMMRDQASKMGQYLYSMEVRASHLGIEL